HPLAAHRTVALIAGRHPLASRGVGRLIDVVLTMEWILALAIGVHASSGVWLLLRPRTFQFIMGLPLLGYAVNLFIFAMGRLRVDAPPVIDPAWADPASYADPLPQALVLTAIVIGFATKIGRAHV